VYPFISAISKASGAKAARTAARSDPPFWIAHFTALKAKPSFASDSPGHERRVLSWKGTKHCPAPYAICAGTAEQIAPTVQSGRQYRWPWSSPTYPLW
jgi:hypothetical protein